MKTTHAKAQRRKDPIRETWTSPDGRITLYRGNCVDVLPLVRPFDAVVTSPPYAMQRAATYGGVPPADYPAFTCQWMAAARSRLSLAGSVLINIREHREPDGMSDYVHRTRLAVRSDGWKEVDELIWVKTQAMPTAPNSLPRRAWERVLWFSKKSMPHCTPRDITRPSQWSLSPTLVRYFQRSIGKGTGTLKRPRYPRFTNVYTGPVNQVNRNHPAVFPVAFAKWLINLAPGTICDPFIGSGTTAEACFHLGRRCIGIELDRSHFRAAVRRIAALYDSARVPAAA